MDQAPSASSQASIELMGCVEICRLSKNTRQPTLQRVPEYIAFLTGHEGDFHEQRKAVASASGHAAPLQSFRAVDEVDDDWWRNYRKRLEAEFDQHEIMIRVTSCRLI